MPLPPVPSARPAAPAPMPSPVMEPPIVKKELSRRDAEVLRKNIELFVDGVMMEDRYKLVDLLNESFTMDMLDLLFKRMTAKLRMILFSRAKTNEFIRIALDPKLPRHTRALATSFIVVGSAASCVMACPKDEHRCLDFWDTIFGALQQEAHDAALASAGGGGYGPATGANMSSTSNGVQQSVDTKAADDEAVAELVEIINVEVKDIQHHGAKSLQRSVVEKEQAKQAAQDNGEEEDEEEEFRNSVSDDEEPRTPTSARTSAAEETDGQTPNGSSKPTTSLPAQGKPNDSAPSDSKLLVGIFSANTANFSSQILRYFAIRGQKGGCILHYLAEHPHLVEVMLANIGHDDTRTLLLHLIYSDHSEAAIQSIFKSRIIDMMIDRLVTFGPPRNAFDRDCVENTFLLLREIVHAPYLTARGVAISAKTIPIDKVTGQDEYVSICGASREMANSSLRKYTSRKVRHVVHLFMQDNQARIEELFMQMIQELTFWSSPVDVGRERRGSVTSMESIEALSLVRAGHPRPVCTAMLSHLFELTETVDFSEEHTKKTGSNAAAATSVGIDCLNFMCSTHLVRTGKLILKKKLRNELQLCQLSVNCMMGLRITSIRKEQPNTTPTSGDTGLIHNKGNQVQFTLDEIEGVESSDWHKHGFMVSVKKKAVMEVELGYMSEQVTRSEEYFAASSEEEKESWIKLLREVINGDLTALEIFCSDDWRSNVREYRRLRECLITSMEHKGHELMVFLKQVIVLNKRRASGFHLYSIVRFLNSVLSNESKRLDQMFVFARLLAVLMQCYEKYPNFNLLLGEITKMILFVLGDFKNKRSRRCPIIGRLLLSQEPEAKLLPLLTKAFVDTEGGKTSVFAGTDTLSNLKLIMESIKLCYKDPKSRSQERVQAVLREDPAWQKLLDAVEQDCTRNPSNSITSLSIPQAKTSSSAVTPDNVVIPVAPTQPSFQEDIINQITRPCYFSAHGFGSSFLEGDGCAFGYMFKERQGGAKWQKVLLVYEYVSYKLWYFYPSGVDETHHIQWKWIVPVGVRSRYTHGHDETHSSVGHHGLYVTAYDHHQDHGSLLHHDTPAGTRELHFSVTKLEDRDQWKAVLSKAAETIQQLARDYTVMQAKLKKPDKKSVTHCQDSTCQQQFKLFRRPHSCKRCGNWFCGKCTQQRLSIPEFGLMHPVRHCRKCYEAAGGLESEVEPKKLFNGGESTGSFSSNGRNSRSGSVATRDSETDRRSSFSNVELYELAHGMVSPRSMLKMRRRMNRLDSIDSPTSAFKVDEMDGENHSRKFFGDDYEESAADELSPYNSPPASVTFMMHDAEDARG